MSNYLIELLITVPAVLIAIIFHELSHGLTSYLFGDPTPKENKRLSLNPKYHLDLVGTLCLIFFHFGWAKPVMINPNYYKHPKLMTLLVALAGPLANFILAFLSVLIISIGYKFDISFLTNPILLMFFMNLAYVNLGLGIFNLIPIPPLDGSKILGSFLDDETYYNFMSLEKYSILIIFIILLFGNDLFAKLLDIIIDFTFNLFI